MALSLLCRMPCKDKLLLVEFLGHDLLDLCNKLPAGEQYRDKEDYSDYDGFADRIAGKIAAEGLEGNKPAGLQRVW